MRDHPSLREDLPELRGAVDRCDRRAVSHEVRVAVRDDDDVAGHQGHRTAVLFDPGIGPSFENEMEDDDVAGSGGQIRRHRAGVRFPGAPGGREFAVEEDRAVEFDGFEYFGEDIHRDSAWFSRTVRKEFRTTG